MEMPELPDKKIILGKRSGKEEERRKGSLIPPKNQHFC
jgi:hypothetical protein